MKTHRPPLASFLAFELRRVLRSPGVLVWTLAFPVVFYLVNFANKTNNPGAERWAGTTWAVYFMVSMCAWAAIAASSNAGGARLAAERASGCCYEAALLTPRSRTTGVPASYSKTQGSPPSTGSDVRVNVTGRPLRWDICVHSTWNRQ